MNTAKSQIPSSVNILGARIAEGALFGGASADSPGSEREARPIVFDAASDVTPPALATGWAEFLVGLDRAREALEDPANYPPAPNDRNLAEG